MWKKKNHISKCCIHQIWTARRRDSERTSLVGATASANGQATREKLENLREHYSLQIWTIGKPGGMKLKILSNYFCR